MKNVTLLNWTAVCLSSLAVNTAAHARADQPAVADKQDKTYSGIVASVEPGDRVLKVHGPFFSKAFKLGDSCGYVFLDSGSRSIDGLHAGQKVLVGYRTIDGLRIADVVTQQPMVFEGTVKDIDAQKQTMSVRHMGYEKTFNIAAGCPIDLYNHRSGTLANVQPGNRVTVTYETPHDNTVARRITQNSQIFTGQLTALDLNDRTAKASDVMARKKFNLAPTCVVVINGNTSANLRDIRLGERLEFDYVDVDGFSIVNRIAATPQSPSRMTASSSAPTAPAGY
jgi:predicted RNA-binding protein